MVDVHIKEFERLLRAKLEAEQLKTIDHWNNQLATWDKQNNFAPAVFIDFGSIQWQPLISDTYRQGQCTITLHCISNNYRITKDKAYNQDGKRFKRFDLVTAVEAALSGAQGKAANGNTIFNRLQLTGSTFDTNHDALTDDVLTFTCQIFYYQSWIGKDYTEIIIQDFLTPLDDTIQIP